MTNAMMNSFGSIDYRDPTAPGHRQQLPSERDPPRVTFTSSEDGELDPPLNENPAEAEGDQHQTSEESIWDEDNELPAAEGASSTSATLLIKHAMGGSEDAKPQPHHVPHYVHSPDPRHYCGEPGCDGYRKAVRSTSLWGKHVGSYRVYNIEQHYTTSHPDVVFDKNKLVVEDGKDPKVKRRNLKMSPKRKS